MGNMKTTHQSIIINQSELAKFIMNMSDKQEWIERARMKWYGHRFFEFIYWRLPFGAIVTVDWPTASCPDKNWRPWLEENLGRQGYKWNWRMSLTKVDCIDIRFLSRKMASYFILTNSIFLSK